MFRVQAVLFAFVVGAVAPRALASEILVPEVTRATIGGEWEGAWRDKVAGRLLAFVLHVPQDEKGKASLVIAHGPTPHPLFEPFDVVSIECTAGHADIKGVGVGLAADKSFVMTANGWATSEDGFLDVSVRTTDRTGGVATFELRLNKLQGGFFRNADRLVQAIRKHRKKADKSK